MTRHTQHLASIATIAVAALALSGCQSAGSGTPTATASTSTPATSASPTATSTPTPTASPEEVAIAAAEKKIPEYFAVADRSLQDPDTFKLDDFKVQEERFRAVLGFTGQMLTQTGAAKVESIENPRVALEFDLEKSPPDVPTVQLDVCVDVSKINMVNEAGESQIPATRAPRQLWRIGVSNYEYPSPDDWRVSFTDTQGGRTC